MSSACTHDRAGADERRALDSQPVTGDGCRGDGAVDLGVLVATARLAAQRARAADVAPLGGGDERDRAEDDDDRDPDCDDDGCTHVDLTVRRTSRRATGA
jgi:hypothetical protein